MLKILSVKTRREGSSREAFRRHYEERHVPLGLGFIDRFRWRKYVRNHVVSVRAGRADFDCLTEFWVASRDDQESTRIFAASPEFRVLDDDDARFLDVTRRFSCELEESLFTGTRPPFEPRGTRRLAAIFSRPESLAEEAFVRSIEAGVRLAAAGARASGVRFTLDRRVSPGPRPREFAAIVSRWSAPGDAVPTFEWKGEPAPDAVVELDVVETPADALFRPA